MKHLKILSILNFVSAALTALGFLAVLVGTGLSAAGLFSAGASTTDVIISVGINVVVLAILAPLGLLEVYAGVRVRQAKGRIAQTLLALASVLNCPLGTAFAAYSLWVCWINEETVALFSAE